MLLCIQPVKRLCKREILYEKQQILMHSRDICCFYVQPSVEEICRYVAYWTRSE